VVETARILREAYAETLIVPLTVLKAASAESLAAGLATVDADVRRYRLVASEATLRARILQRPETEGPHAWCLDHLAAGVLLMANAAFGQAVPTDNRDPEAVMRLRRCHRSAPRPRAERPEAQGSGHQARMGKSDGRAPSQDPGRLPHVPPGHPVRTSFPARERGLPYCTYDFFAQCPHRMACARCSFYRPKGSTQAQLLEGKANLLRMKQDVLLTDDERAAVDDGLSALETLCARLADVPTPAGPTPRNMAPQADP
jgi:hypothetical protein